MRDLDQMLREGLRDPASWGDPEGVAEAVRSRVAAGDTGTAAGAGTPFRQWPGPLGWLVTGLLVAIGSLLIGATAQFDPSLPDPTAEDLPTSATAVVAGSVPGHDCPAGRPVVSFHAGDRVYVVARSADSTHLAVRNPVDHDRTVWVSTDDVVADAGPGALQALAEADCATEVLAGSVEARAGAATPGPSGSPSPDLPVPSTSAGPEHPPTTAAPPRTRPTTPPGTPTPSGGNETPAVDQPPAVTSLTITGSPFCGHRAATVVVSASDDHEVVSMTLAWAGAESGSATMSPTGDTWEFTWLPAPGTRGDVTFTATARDAAGLTATRSGEVRVDCLI